MMISADRVGLGPELAGGLGHGSSPSAELPNWAVDAGAIGRAEEDRLDWIENQTRCRAGHAQPSRWALAALSACAACIAAVVALLT